MSKSTSMCRNEMIDYLPAGTYYLGDLSFVFTRSTWSALLKQNLNGMKHINDVPLWLHQTKHGDGVFTDQNGIEYRVDSGTLGVAPIELVDDPNGERFGTVMDFPSGIRVEYENGTFWFGWIYIETSLESEPDVNTDLDGGYDGDLSKDRL